MPVSPDELTAKLALRRKSGQRIGSSATSKNLSGGAEIESHSLQGSSPAAAAQNNFPVPVLAETDAGCESREEARPHDADQLVRESTTKESRNRGESRKLDSRGGEKPSKKTDSMPQAAEAEQAVLCAMLRWPETCVPEAKRRLHKSHFFNPVNAELFNTMVRQFDAGRYEKSRWLIPFTQFLIDTKRIDAVGGIGYVTDIATGSVADSSVPFYAEMLREKFVLREMITVGASMSRAAFGAAGDDVSQMVADFSHKLEQIRYAASGVNGSERFNFDELMAFDSHHDPLCLVGNRYLVKGGSSLWAGGSGYGKSSLLMQLAIYWACGRSWCNLRPVRPLKSLIIQAENDLGDMGEQLQGVFEGVKAIGDIDPDESRSQIERNIGFHRVVSKSGHEFLALLDSLIEIDRPDIVWIDPLFSFAGCDLMDAEKTGHFLRHGLFSIADKRKVSMNVVHHAGKPSRAGDDKGEPMSEIDFQYLGFGTSEIQNAFRAVNVLVPAGGGVFKLVLSKRGERARAKDVDGEWARTLYLEHGKEGKITWTPCDKPDEPEKVGQQKFYDKDILDQLSVVHPVTLKHLRTKLSEDRNMSRATFYRITGELQKDGRMTPADGGWIRKARD